MPVTGCVRYHAVPITPEASLEDFEARRLDAPELGTFLQERGETSAWPPSAFDLHDLTLAAFYYSPALDVARAQWGVARGGVITAGARPNPSVTGALGYNATTPVDEVTPWIPEVALELPIEVAGKRGIRIAEARQRSESARYALLTTAWQVRSRVRQAFLDLHVARQTDSLLNRQFAILTETVRILEARRAAGETSPTEVTRAHIDLAASRAAAFDAARAAAVARSELADALGVPPGALDSIRLDFAELRSAGAALPSADVRRRALLNRTDLLGALADYGASQSALQLEVRKQYPDLTLGPGYQLDQTDSKWILGLGISLPSFNRNRGPIAEAAARREEAAAAFLTIQSRVLGEVESAVASAGASIAQVQAADTLLQALGRQQATAQAAYDAGEISRLDLLGLQAEMVSTALTRLDALAMAQRTLGALEDAMQTPLDIGPWVLEAPRRSNRREGDGR
jgi:outer membrane protein TolC